MTITCSNCDRPYPITTDDLIIACPRCAHRTFSPGLPRCAVCGGLLTESEAAPAPDDAAPRYHADFSLCIRQTFAAPERATAVMRAVVGMEEGR